MRGIELLLVWIFTPRCMEKFVYFEYKLMNAGLN